MSNPICSTKNHLRIIFTSKDIVHNRHQYENLTILAYRRIEIDLKFLRSRKKRIVFCANFTQT